MLISARISIFEISNTVNQISRNKRRTYVASRFTVAWNQRGFKHCFNQPCPPHRVAPLPAHSLRDKHRVINAVGGHTFHKDQTKKTKQRKRLISLTQTWMCSLFPPSVCAFFFIFLPETNLGGRNMHRYDCISFQPCRRLYSSSRSRIKFSHTVPIYFIVFDKNCRSCCTQTLRNFQLLADYGAPSGRKR